MLLTKILKFFATTKEYHRWDTPYQTKNGIHVRSKGELEIANFLFDQKMHFEYEREIRLGSWTLHPDFYLPASDIFIEYFGMDTPEYKRGAWFRKRLYEQYGLRLIPLYYKSRGSLGAVIKRAYETITHEKFPQAKYFDWHIRHRASNYRFA